MYMKKIWKKRLRQKNQLFLLLLLLTVINNSYLCNQLGNALFCVTSGIFAGRAQRDPAKSHELHKIANVLVTYKIFSNFDKKKVYSNVKRSNEFH
jgi:hypothetical protein